MAGHVAMAVEPTRKAVLCTFQGEANGVLDGGAGFVDDDVGQAAQLHDEVALLVEATLAAVDVGQVQADVVDVFFRVSQGRNDLVADVAGDRIFRCQALGVDVDLHVGVSV
jgi:hypothetical protein